ncbi:MAG: TrkH family potassium uptake protein [Pseudomonadota bacterium]|nr:TrkH family potassium uptake protein [Pseudomonadota bacterium]
MRFQRIVPPLGLLLCLAGIGMLVPALVDLATANRDWQVFLVSAFFAGGTGAFLFLGFRNRTAERWSRRDGFVFVAASWLVLSVASALPFCFADVRLSLADAFFESVSGLTTTGATVIPGLDTLPPGILMWRSILQWTGGVGIVVLSVFLFPFLKLGGQQLFSLESSDTAEKSFARFEQYAVRILLLYLLLTVMCMSGYHALGMTFFDAVNHAMTTVSTGGFSTSDLSLAKFDSLPILWVATVFMFLGSMPFIVLLFMFSSRRRQFDIQIVWFVAIIAACVMLVMFAVSARGDAVSFATLTTVVFTVTSIITTTGYVFQDYGSWPLAALMGVFLITLLGGCSGSTSGGFKVFRLVILVAICRAAIARLLWPSAVQSTRYGARTVDEETTVAVVAFSLLYGLTFAAGAMILALSGQDALTSITASATAIANVGPGLGDKVGPVSNFAALPDFDKIVLAFEMLLGRLEIMSILPLLVPGFWRD